MNVQDKLQNQSGSGNERKFLSQSYRSHNKPVRITPPRAETDHYSPSSADVVNRSGAEWTKWMATWPNSIYLRR